MPFLLIPDGIDQIQNGTGSVILQGNLNTRFFNLSRLRPYLTSSAWEVSRSLSVIGNIDYEAVANRLTGSDFTRQDEELRIAETLLTVSHLSIPGNLRFSARGGNVKNTSFKDSLNALSSFQEAKQIKNHFRVEANKFIRRAINEKIKEVSGSADNIIGEGGYAVENPDFRQSSGSQSC